MMSFLNRNLKFTVRLFPIILILVQFMTISLAIIKPTKFVGEEKAAIEKLRKAVGNKLTIEYMKTDDYLFKWIKAKDFNVEKALEALEQTLKWRKEVDADNLPFYDFGQLKETFILDFESRDLEGRPVGLLPLQLWNIRKAVISGKLSKVTKLMDYAEEMTAQLSYNRTGVSNGMFIVDLNGFNLRKQGCIACVPVYTTWVIHHEKYYPYNFYRSTGINAPAIINPIINLMRPLMTKSTRDAFLVFDYDKSTWQKYLLETIAPEQLPLRFGGTSKRKLKS